MPPPRLLLLQSLRDPWNPLWTRHAPCRTATRPLYSKWAPNIRIVAQTYATHHLSGSKGQGDGSNSPPTNTSASSSVVQQDDLPRPGHDTDNLDRRKTTPIIRTVKTKTKAHNIRTTVYTIGDSSEKKFIKYHPSAAGIYNPLSEDRDVHFSQNQEDSNVKNTKERKKQGVSYKDRPAKEWGEFQSDATGWMQAVKPEPVGSSGSTRASAPSSKPVLDANQHIASDSKDALLPSEQHQADSPAPPAEAHTEAGKEKEASNSMPKSQKVEELVQYERENVQDWPFKSQNNFKEMVERMVKSEVAKALEDMRSGVLAPLIQLDIPDTTTALATPGNSTIPIAPRATRYQSPVTENSTPIRSAPPAETLARDEMDRPGVNPLGPLLLKEFFPELASQPNNNGGEPAPTKHRTVPRLALPDFRIPGNLTNTQRLKTRHPHPQLGRSESVSEPWILELSNASLNLSKHDFELVIPRGQHITGWKSDGVFTKVIPKRDPVSLARLDSYYIIFPSAEASKAYQLNALKLARLSNMYSHKSLESPVPYPPGWKEDDEDIHSVLQSYTIKSPPLSLRLMQYDPPYASKLQKLSELGGYPAIIADQDTRPFKVLLYLDGGPDVRPSTSTLLDAIIRDSLVGGDVPSWRFPTRRQDILVPLHEATLPAGAELHMDNRSKTEGKWIVSFLNELDAVRFAREWKGRRVTEATSSTSGVVWKGQTITLPSPTAWTEVLW